MVSIEYKNFALLVALEDLSSSNFSVALQNSEELLFCHIFTTVVDVVGIIDVLTVR
jgi:hypothetical protein